MRRLTAFAALATVLAGCSGTAAPPQVAEVDCRSRAERAAAADFRAYTRERIAEDLAIVDSPLVYDDIHERACD
ncbi:MAG TPA: hypothetical protein VD995_13965 [Azospirillum sp.]|nr:hypothetical protein [Azospirillum sp.]